jgi:hypothetical protein
MCANIVADRWCEENKSDCLSTDYGTMRFMEDVCKEFCTKYENEHPNQVQESSTGTRDSGSDEYEPRVMKKKSDEIAAGSENEAERLESTRTQELKDTKGLSEQDLLIED